MKFILMVFMTVITVAGFSQTVEGTWIAMDEETNKPGAEIILKVENGSLVGHIDKVLTGRNPKCTECEGDKKDQPYEGLEMVWGFSKKSDREWVDGKILDPESGKIYSSKIKLKNKNTLKVRGYLGVSLLGRTSVWTRK